MIASPEVLKFFYLLCFPDVAGVRSSRFTGFINDEIVSKYSSLVTSIPVNGTYFRDL